MTRRTVSRRRFVKNTVALSSALVAAPFVRGAYAAGKLSVGLWDHWVPGANAGAEAVAKAWAEKEKVDLQLDFITSQGNKLILTAAAEAQARSGHDILALGSWDCARYADQLTPVDDVMASLVQQNGKASAITTYLGVIDGKWLGVPGTPGAQFKGPACCFRRSMRDAGPYIQAMYPAGAPPKADSWTTLNALRRLASLISAVGAGPRLRAAEDRFDHFVGEAAGERVLLAWVVAAEQEQWRLARAGDRYFRAVAEGWPWARDRVAVVGKGRPECLPGEAAQADDRLKGGGDQAELLDQPGGARVAFFGGRLVSWRRAAHGGDHAGAGQLLAVVRGDARRLAGQADPVQ